jgi:hypothetical protein
LLIALLLSDFAHDGLDDFTATNAIAAAAVRTTLALVTRASENKRFRLNECGVSILVGAELVDCVGGLNWEGKCNNVKGL